MPEEKMNQCEMCDEASMSRLDIVEHIRNDHTAKERLAALINRVPAEQIMEEEAVNES